MGTRIKIAVGETYHVYNRGVDKRVVFESVHDYQRFLLLLLLANDNKTVDIHQSIRNYSIPQLIVLERNPIVAIGAFSLLPNHYHMIISPLVDDGITAFMRKVATGYSMYFNAKNERTGTLFQGRYKAKHIDTDVYLQYMYEYVHLNPVRKEFDCSNKVVVEKLIEQLEKDPFTSLSSYAGNENGRLSSEVLSPNMFYTMTTYEKHIESLKQWRENNNE